MYCDEHRVDDKRVVKVADFGLARDIDASDYYRLQDKKRGLPFKWMAPECFDTFKFDPRSDVVCAISVLISVCTVYVLPAMVYVSVVIWSDVLGNHVERSKAVPFNCQ